MCHVFLVTKRLGCNLQQVGMVELGVVSHRKKTAVKTALPTDRLVETPVMRVSWMAQETFFFLILGRDFLAQQIFFGKGFFGPGILGFCFFLFAFAFWEGVDFEKLFFLEGEVFLLI